MKKTLNAVTDVYNKAKNFIISGSGQFTTKVRNILKKYGNEIIHSIVVCRSPVPSMIQKALQVASFNNVPFDTLFHLFIIINGNILLEKNSVINMSINPRIPSDTEHMECPTPSNTTINEFLNKCLQSMGSSKFFSYSGYDNNCQNFILHLLNSNGILSNELNQFIKQNTESIFENNPTLRKLTNNITDVDGRVHELMGGRLIPYTTYKVYAKKYKIKLTKNGKRKHMSELSKEIHEYESKHNILDGLYAY